MRARSVGVVNTDSYISELSVTVSTTFNNRIIRCSHNSGTGERIIGTSTLTVVSAPLPPISLIVTSIGETEVSLSWLTNSSVLTPITAIKLNIYPALGVPLRQVLSGNVNSTNITGLMPSREYTFSIAAMNCASSSEAVNITVRTKNIIVPPPQVQALCSVVVWDNPAVSCRDIIGYDVRFYSLQLVTQNVTRRVGANGTYYIVQDKDRLNIEQKDIYVQVRVIHRTIGEWSKGISLGCEEPTTPPKAPNIYFELKGTVYTNNSATSLSELGEGENALLCKTKRELCCRTPPNRFGEFYYPNGIKVPIAKEQQGFYRNRGEKVIRLNRRDGVTSPTGKYHCEIPDANGMIQNIYITLSA